MTLHSQVKLVCLLSLPFLFPYSFFFLVSINSPFLNISISETTVCGDSVVLVDTVVKGVEALSVGC